ncbi:putative ABC transport system permease protein [Cupriavidus sp. YR651]|uniref:ABC transporter permease n=1 Tax=Cupriavidus sp. YR651 TaxID=1855315 RepID=UPI000886999E|nr:iron export ABC transporter permease subunit FetB [Cupriavidus sp. YR651]SDC70041.1 putative ABC transport system permease protein [Cupriavidus sp. YR651]
MTPIDLTAADLLLASLLILAGAGLSVALSLNIHRTLLWTACRMVVQLLLVGLTLRAVFALSSPWLTLGVVLAMVAAAAHEVSSRQERRLQGPWQAITGAAAVSLPTLVITVLALTTALRPSPWYDARHAIPLAGIVLGNAMNAASLALHAAFSMAWLQRGAIDARLALGEDRHTALRPIVRHAIRSGLMPTMNTMAAAGIITMPGIMTGQILAGMDPIAAARYQILLMFLLTGGSVLGVIVAAYLAVSRMTDERHRLRLDRLVAR